MKNYYVILQLRILLSTILKGKISIKKVFNAAYCFLAYQLHLKKTGKYPFMINFELWNECNVKCLFCRSLKGDIYDQNPNGLAPIPKGKMDYELFTEIIEQVKDYLLMAALYVNGEPLLYKNLYKAIRYASDRGIATMIASNGLLLNEKNIVNLLDSGLDFIKIAISGFTQSIYNIQHRNSNIEEVKKNIRTLARFNKEGGYKLLIMIDYMSYKYNAHELEVARRFCKDLGLMFSVRPGNLRGLEDVEPSPGTEVFNPAKSICDWPWKVMTVNWNGDLFACCDYLVWSGSKPYARFETGKTTIVEVWNGRQAIQNRIIHIRKGRKAIPVCAKCTRQGTAFKY